MNASASAFDDLISQPKAAQKRQIVEYKVLPNEAVTQ
jgi:hypothetical protein